ncbi:MAG: hypothetical protein KBS76_03420, partial [Ruminococcus sp.]|nr:hypothetical protein [Candidatus Apopatosoma intestinale]
INNWVPPTLDEVRAYCAERGNKVDPERWHSFYAAKGFMIGQNRMADWRASIRSWESQNDPSRVARGGAQTSPKNEPSFDLDEFFHLALKRGKKQAGSGVSDDKED